MTAGGLADKRHVIEPFDSALHNKTSMLFKTAFCAMLNAS